MEATLGPTKVQQEDRGLDFNRKNGDFFRKAVE